VIYSSSCVDSCSCVMMSNVVLILPAIIIDIVLVVLSFKIVTPNTVKTVEFL